MTGRSPNVATALGILDDIVTGTLDRARFTSDASWWWNTGQTFPLSDFLDILAPLHAETVGGVAITPGVVIDDGARVVIEATSNAQLHDGRHYSNRYLFLFHFDGERVRQVREYSDTAHVGAVFGLSA